MTRATLALAATLSAAMVLPAAAQSIIDVDALEEIDDIEIVTADGEEIGEIDDVLIDPSGRVVAVVVETGGFLDIGDRELLFALDQLSFRDGDYVTTMTRAEVEAMPEYDD